MPARAVDIAIAGAGIAGLSAALCCAQAGFSVTLLERAEKLEEVGAGLQLSPNATRILARLGVLDAIEAKAVRADSVEIRKAATLARLAIVPLRDAQARWGAPYLTVHRADLHAALLDAAEADARIALVTGVTARQVRFDDDCAVLDCERGEGRREEARCRLAVAADGVWSGLRRAMGEGRASRYTGCLAWRAMAEPSPGLLPVDRVTTWVHPRFHLVAYPVRDGAAVNLVAVTNSPSSAERWSNAGDVSLLLEAMTGVAPALRALVAATGPWTTWPIHEVPRDHPWTDARGFALVGDAAHAMSPFAAQGAAMAIEDAAVLAACLKRNPDDRAQALRAYEAARRSRIDRVASRGAFNRFAWHAAGPVAFVRDRVLALRPPERLAGDLDWLYGYEVGNSE